MRRFLCNNERCDAIRLWICFQNKNMSIHKLRLYIQSVFISLRCRPYNWVGALPLLWVPDIDLDFKTPFGLQSIFYCNINTCILDHSKVQIRSSLEVEINCNLQNEWNRMQRCNSFLQSSLQMFHFQPYTSIPENTPNKLGLMRTSNSILSHFMWHMNGEWSLTK